MNIKDLIEKSLRAIKYNFYKDLAVLDQIKVNKILDDNATQLFWRMRLEDRSHSLEVMN